MALSRRSNEMARAGRRGTRASSVLRRMAEPWLAGASDFNLHLTTLTGHQDNLRMLQIYLNAEPENTSRVS